MLQHALLTFNSYRFESCWPAFSKDACGVIIVYNPSRSREEELEKWYEILVTDAQLFALLRIKSEVCWCMCFLQAGFN